MRPKVKVYSVMAEDDFCHTMRINIECALRHLFKTKDPAHPLFLVYARDMIAGQIHSWPSSHSTQITSYDVICDSSNNTTQTRDNGELHARVTISTTDDWVHFLAFDMHA
jgi:hypothetical protein